jgi:hypothetical protein
MSRRRGLVIVVLAGLAAGVVAQVLDPSGSARELCFLVAGLAIGELLVLRLEDGSAIPLSYALFIVLASSFSFPEYAAAVLGAELIAIVVRPADRATEWRAVTLLERLVVAGATYAAFASANAALGHRDTVAAVLLTLACAAVAQVVVDVVLRWVLRLGATFSPRGRLAWLAVASSGMLMAIGYSGVGGNGEIGIWGPLLFCTPLLAAWYAFERLDSATRAFRQTIEALAMAPEFGGLVPPGHATRVSSLAVRIGHELGLSTTDVEDLEIAALLHHLGQVTLDEPHEPHGVESTDVAAVTSAMLREIRPLAAAGDIVAGEVEHTRRRLAVQALRVASDYDDLTVRDGVESDVAIESLRSTPAYVYDPRVVSALERILLDPTPIPVVPHPVPVVAPAR